MKILIFILSFALGCFIQWIGFSITDCKFWIINGLMIAISVLSYIEGKKVK